MLANVNENFKHYSCKNAEYIYISEVICIFITYFL